MSDSTEDLKFQGGDPGAVHHGNFINYYSFHPANQRVSNFPDNIWNVPKEYPSTLACLDVGCNTGELTIEMHNVVSKFMRRDGEGPIPVIKTLGVDIDPTLIQRAQENSSGNETIKFVPGDITDEKSAGAIVKEFLTEADVSRFGAVFLMSVSMWVHLLNGDEGLELLIKRCAELTDRWLVIEPQPWNCYRSAQRRLIKSGNKGFMLYSSLTIKGPSLIPYIEKLLTEKYGFNKIYETKPSNWNRTVLFYEKVGH